MTKNLRDNAAGRGGTEAEAGAAADERDGSGGGVFAPGQSLPGGGRPLYPYLLRNLAITRPNQVWVTGILFIRLRQEVLYSDVLDRLVQPVIYVVVWMVIMTWAT